MIPRAAVANPHVLDMPKQHRLYADDLWLCYHANHGEGLALRRAKLPIPITIDVDGKDTYAHHHQDKIGFLNDLRGRGWEV